MRTRTWLVGVAGTAVLVAGALTGSALITGSPTAAPASATPTALAGFRSCEALRDWYVDAGLRLVGPYGWTTDGPVAVAFDAMADGGTAYVRSPAATAPGAAEAQTGSGTGTNVQESDVDEPDIAKTNGRRLVRVAAGRLEVYDMTGSAPQRTGSFALPGEPDVSPAAWELLLVGNTVVALRAGAAYGNVTFNVERGPFRHPQPDETRVLVLRLTEGDPVVTSDRTWSGHLLAARQHGDVVRLVLRQGLPGIAFPQPTGASVGQPRAADLRDATRRNRALVRATHLDDWLPMVRDTGRPVTDARPAVACDDVLHPTRDAGAGTLTLVGFDPTSQSGTARPSTTAITTDGDQVYAGDDALYVATSRYQFHPMAPGTPIAGGVLGGSSRTDVHRFDLDGTSASYVASGTVLGTLKDRWSMDAHAGRLRLAVERSGPRGVPSSSVVVLARDGQRLVQTGRVDGLGRGEQIKSVRWFDDLAVVVTYRQTDPLYVLDLADGAHPRLRGALKVNGFSGYLHPVGQDRLLGLGSDTDPRTGSERGALVQLFDLADPDHPRQTTRAVLGATSWLPAVDDPRTLTWTSGRVGYTPVALESGAALIRISQVGGGVLVRRTPLPQVDDAWAVRTLALPDDRIALVTPRSVSYLS